MHFLRFSSIGIACISFGIETDFISLMMKLHLNSSFCEVSQGPNELNTCSWFYSIGRDNDMRHEIACFVQQYYFTKYCISYQKLFLADSGELSSFTGCLKKICSMFD